MPGHSAKPAPPSISITGVFPTPLPLPENSKNRPGIVHPAYEQEAQPANHGSGTRAAMIAEIAGSAACTPEMGPLRDTTCSASSPPSTGTDVFSTWMKSPVWARRALMFSPPLPMIDAAALRGTMIFSRAPPGSTFSSPPLTAPASCRNFVRAWITAASDASCVGPRTLSSCSVVPG